MTTVIATAAVASFNSPAAPTDEVLAFRISTTDTLPPEPEGDDGSLPLVAAGAVITTLEEETELIEQAAEEAATTTTTTTQPAPPTSGPPATTPPATSPPSTSPPPTSPPPTVQAGFVSSAESEFASRINSYRGSQGVESLSRNGSLDSYARSWAKTLAERGSLSHSNIGSLIPPWTSVGENVGRGGSVGPIFDALVASSGHRANIVGDYTDFGIGVYRDSSGVLWTSHVFGR